MLKNSIFLLKKCKKMSQENFPLKIVLEMRVKNNPTLETKSRFLLK